MAKNGQLTVDFSVLNEKLTRKVKRLFKKKYPIYTFTKLKIEKYSDVVVTCNVLFTDSHDKKWQLTRVFGLNTLIASRADPCEIIFNRIENGLDSNLKGMQQSWQ